MMREFDMVSDWMQEELASKRASRRHDVFRAISGSSDTQRWREENRKTTQNYNKHVEKYGVFGDGIEEF
ncbi:hypothetical protein D9M68_46950 [compost metagenome]